MKALEVGLNLGPSKHRLQSSRFIHYAMTPYNLSGIQIVGLSGIQLAFKNQSVQGNLI